MGELLARIINALGPPYIDLPGFLAGWVSARLTELLP